MSSNFPWFVRYAAAVIAAAVAFLARQWFILLAGGALPTYITFYPMVMLVALGMGLGPGVLTTVAAAFSV